MAKKLKGLATCLAPVLAGILLGRFEADWLVGLLLSAAVLWLGWENFRWLRRARWAGPVVLAEAGAPMRQFRWRGWALAVLGALGAAIWFRPDLSFVLAMNSILTAGWFYAIGSAPEFRERGIVFAGKLFRWSEIGSHAWPQSGRFVEVASKHEPDIVWVRARLPMRPELRAPIDSFIKKMRAESANLLQRGNSVSFDRKFVPSDDGASGGGWLAGSEVASAGLSGEDRTDEP